MPDSQEPPSVQTGTLSRPGSSVPASRWWPAALFLTSALCLAVRLIDLDGKSVFADEMSSFTFAKMNWTAFWHVITGSEANMALYYVLLRFWIRIGDSVWFIRFLSVFLAVATVPVIYYLGTKLFSRSTGLLAALLFSLNVYHISYSQAARGYTLAVLLVSLSCLYFVKSIADPDIRSAAAYVTGSTAGLYSHFFAGFVLLAQFVSLFFLRSRVAILRQIRLMVVIAVLGGPLLVFAAIHKTGPLAWVQPPTGKDVYHFLTYLTGSGLKFGICFLALIVVGREWWQRTVASDPKQKATWPFVFLTLWFLLPLGIALAVSHWKPVFSPRFLMISLPAFLLLTSQGLSGIRPHWARSLVVLILLVSLATALPSYYRRPGFEDWNAVNNFLAQKVQANDTIFVDPAYRDVFQFTYQRSGRPLPTQNVIIDLGLKTDHGERSDRIWIISCHPTHTAQGPIPPLPEQYVPGPTTKFPGIEVLQYVKSGAG